MVLLPSRILAEYCIPGTTLFVLPLRLFAYQNDRIQRKEAVSTVSMLQRTGTSEKKSLSEDDGAT